MTSPTYQIPDWSTQIKYKVVLMTPEWAERLLSKNHPNNRATKKQKISQMVGDILVGNWVLTPEPIVISDQDQLIDGQNRCYAIVEANISVPVVLCTGVPESVLICMDLGASRNVPDMMKFSGQSTKYAHQVAAIARCMAGGLSSYKASRLSVKDCLEWIEVHQKAIQFSWECLPISKTSLTQAPVRAVLARAYYRRPVTETRVRCLEFGEVFFSGLPKNAKADSAALRLRNWLLDNFTTGLRDRAKARPSQLIVYAKTETALTHFLNEEMIESLRETKYELFPLPGDEE